MRTYERYQEYQPSGIDWIEEIPSHWSIKKLKFSTSINQNTLTDKTDKNYLIQYVDIGNVDKNGLIDKPELLRFEDAPSRARRMVLNGDIIISTVRTYLKALAYFEKADNNLIASTGFAVLTSDDFCHKKFLYYFVSSDYFIQQVSYRAVGIMYPSIGLYEIGSIKISLPPLDEQKSIANFLDQKSKQIDEFIADKQALIALFEEQKTAIINDAVTKGLDKTTPLIPSGIEWIDEIPSHWLMRKVSRSFSTIGSGTTPSSGNDTYYKDGDILWVNSGDLNNSYLYDTEKKVTPLALKDFSALKLFQKNSLIIAMYGATIGKLALLESIACVNQACCVLNDSEYFEIKFVFYWFLANKQNIVNLSFGGGQPNISQDVIKSLKIQAPPLEEQKQIIAYLETELGKIDTLIETAKAEITLIEEYKTSLINEAVTGKIKIHKEDVA